MQQNSAMYQAAQWGYQPIKNIKHLVMDVAATSMRTAKISQYLSMPGFKGLQVGCGPNRYHGWLNSDGDLSGNADVFVDITKRLPFPDNSLDAIYGSEVIEHVSMEQGVRFLSEAHRVLGRGGVLRLTTPDVEAVCRIVLGLNPKATIEMHATTWLEDDKKLTSSIWINAMFRRWGHQHLWDFASMREALTDVGFSEVERVEPQSTKSKFKELENLDTRYGMPPPPHCWESSMILEATKPAGLQDIHADTNRNRTDIKSLI